VQLSHARTTCPMTMTTMVMPMTRRSCSFCVTIALLKARATLRAAKCPDQSEKYLKCVRRSSPSLCPLTPVRSTIVHISTSRGHNSRRHRLTPSPLTVIPNHMHPAAGLPVHHHLLPGNLPTHESVSRSMSTRALQHRHPSRARSPLDPIPISHIPRVLSIRGSSLQLHFSHRHHTNQDFFRASRHTCRQQQCLVAPAVPYTCQHRFRHPRQDLARVLLYPCYHLMGRLDIHHGSHSPTLVRAPMTCSRTCLDPRAEAG